MKIIHRNSLLRSINKNDIELIRIWRNSDTVNHFLRSRDLITETDQIKWLNSLNYSTTIYFMMEESSVPFGVVFADNIDSEARSFDGGIFVGNETYLNSFFPIKAALMLSLFFFEHLRYTIAYSTVHAKNIKALELDLQFGYKQISTNPPFIKSSCTKENFETATKYIRKALLRGERPMFIPEECDKKYTFIKA